MVIINALKDVFSLKFKGSHDSYSDKFNRVLMPKLLLISSLIGLVDYFFDRVNCVTPLRLESPNGFIQSTCWVNGLFIYEELDVASSDNGYYGIPQSINYDGIDNTGNLCSKMGRFGIDPFCIPLKKQYYNQYQWMPFYLAAISLLYIFPYIAFRLVNTDLESLKWAIKNYATDPSMLVQNYFNHEVNSTFQLSFRIYWTAFVKVLYLISGLTAFYLTDYLLNGNYINYGTNTWAWMKRNTTITVTKPGNILLPSMGLCEFSESSFDIKHVANNNHRLLCEISPHILYQCILLVLWIFFVANIFFSSLGLVIYPITHWYRIQQFSKGTSNRSFQRFITFREAEYLECIKESDMVVYGEIKRLLGRHNVGLQEDDSIDGEMKNASV